MLEVIGWLLVIAFWLLPVLNKKLQKNKSIIVDGNFVTILFCYAWAIIATVAMIKYTIF